MVAGDKCKTINIYKVIEQNNTGYNTLGLYNFVIPAEEIRTNNNMLIEDYCTLYESEAKLRCMQLNGQLSLIEEAYQFKLYKYFKLEIPISEFVPGPKFLAINEENFWNLSKEERDKLIEKYNINIDNNINRLNLYYDELSIDISKNNEKLLNFYEKDIKWIYVIYLNDTIQNFINKNPEDIDSYIDSHFDHNNNLINYFCIPIINRNINDNYCYISELFSYKVKSPSIIFVYDKYEPDNETIYHNIKDKMSRILHNIESQYNKLHINSKNKTILNDDKDYLKHPTHGGYTEELLKKYNKNVSDSFFNHKTENIEIDY